MAKKDESESGKEAWCKKMARRAVERLLVEGDATAAVASTYKRVLRHDAPAAWDMMKRVDGEPF